MRTKTLLTVLSGICLLPLLLATSSAAQTLNFFSIDVPCSTAQPFNCPNGLSIRSNAGGVNPQGEIVGNYTDGSGKMHGFLLSSGQFTTIDVPGSLVGATGTLVTAARAISPTGEIVGQFNAAYNPPLSTTAPVDSAEYCPAPGSNACTKGFVYRRGKFEAVIFPGHPGAIAGRITPGGSIYGCLHDVLEVADMFSAAWIRSGDAVSYTSLALGGGELSDPTLSFPNSMHGGATPDGSIVTGFYVDMTAKPNHTHGYVLQNGVLQTYDVRNSTRTVIWDINPGGAMVGTYDDSRGRHGFLQLPDGSAPITIDVPSTAPFNAVSTVILGINPGGAMVGQYTDTKGHTHGFLAVPE